MKQGNINGYVLMAYWESDLDNQDYLQELSEMLSNNLTLDEEDSVQAELRELQASVVRLSCCVWHKMSSGIF